MTIDIVAVISPKAGYADRVEELLLQAAKAVKANEPGTLKYHLQRETKSDAPVFVMLETYKDQASIAAHAKSPDFKALGKTLKQEDLLAEPMRVIFTKEAGGYASKL
ncbi:ABM-domain-containing protein [Macroventuria anomochaeta]|uniref:ABM-domain-containing protein n=1 Tax=Macroventuria anomochaeta TaxID=301207 RepID=A0ACB6S0Q9_9PLEO|nr:ABM-domain-containing protein [Macroventuria anomochaeta]KAF2627825.1 ABM-domain-containing protein [Macroventuria anomochaeta]